MGSLKIAVEAPDSADARACLGAYFAELARRFRNGFDPDRDPLADREMAPPRGVFVIARLDGEPVGCGGLAIKGDGIGEIKRVWTAPSARGLGVAGRVVARLEDLARDLNLTILRLDTNAALAEAQRFYRKRGYREVAPFNTNPYADHWFERRL